MAAVDNHYEFLGLEPRASQSEIEAAIEKVSEQAITLVYSSPQRSADLWERIRHMRRDLLATPEGRQVYDEALRRTENLKSSGRTPPVALRPVFRQPGPQESVAAIRDGELPRLVPVALVEDKEESRGIAWPYALIAAAAIFVAVAGALLAREPGVTPARRPVAMMLSQLGALHGSKFVSGGSITLAWTKVPHASLYHLQIATAPGDPASATVFSHDARTISVTTSTYRLRVTGSQLYYWRVQARVGKIWQRYTASQHFAVAKPSVSMPVALAPVTGIAKGGKHARLCWSAVPHAVGYRLRVQGQPIRTVSGTCVTLSVRPRTYRWSVAALVQGVRVYAGTYSVAAVLRVPPNLHSSHRTHTSRHVVHRGSKSHTATRRHMSTTMHASSSTPHPVEVAAALPAPRFIPASTKRTSLRPAIESIQRRKSALSQPRRTTGNRVSHGVRPVHVIGALPRHTTAATSYTGTSGSVPRIPATPTKKHTPVSSPTPNSVRTPAPPTPSSVAGTATTAPALPPAPTQAVAAAKTPTQSAGIIVRPIVAAQIPTRSAASPTSTRPAVNSANPAAVTYSIHAATPTSPPPAVRTTSPVPTSTKPTFPTSTPVQSGSNGKPDDPKHPEHPEHPVHPTHPDHPAHP